MKLIIVTGPAGSGKSTYVENYSDYEIIHLDKYRYGPKWLKLSYEEFKNNVFDELFKDDNDKVIDGAYFDVNDDEQARNRLIDELIPMCNTKLVIFIFEHELTQVTRILNRSFERIREHTTNESGNVEDASSVARLIHKNVINFDRIKNKYLELYNNNKEIADIYRIPK